MFFIIGLLVVIGSVIGGYMGAGGHVDVLWQPLEFVIIFGAGIGAFLIANSKAVVGRTLKSFGALLKGPKYNAAAYLELLGVLYAVFRLAKTKGDLALESHVEKPHESPLFTQFPNFVSDHHAVDFVCDYLRLLTLGASTSHEVEAVMDVELEVHHDEDHGVVGAVQVFADGAPALGIVAAVLGVIHTMGSITEPPEVLGHLIGGAPGRYLRRNFRVLWGLGADGQLLGADICRRLPLPNVYQGGHRRPHARIRAPGLRRVRAQDLVLQRAA